MESHLHSTTELLTVQDVLST